MLRTDRDGRARVALAVAGPWLLKSVHMLRAVGADAERAEWESLWASSTFEVVGADTARRPPVE
jgi:hypothetical protein